VIRSDLVILSKLGIFMLSLCSHEGPDAGAGGDFTAAMRQIEREEAQRMEQSIRFTVVDPLQARLETHDQLREGIDARDKLAAESKMLRAVTLKMQSSRLEDDDKRAQTEADLHRVAAALQEAEATLLPQLGTTLALAKVAAAVSLTMC